MERIGKYQVIAQLGQGGMARVLLVMPDDMPGFHKLLVVKELKEELARDPDFVSMFVDEARIAARLSHPNIVQSYEVGQDGERRYIAMEYLEGQPFNAVLRKVGRSNFPLDVHLRILCDVLDGLDHAHELTDFDGTPLEVVHRDVSPQNVFLTYEGHSKLVDFGIAKMQGAANTTRQGVIKGKISYVSPEQGAGAAVDRRSDVFSVGVMLWEALARQRITLGEDDMSILGRRIRGGDPDIRSVAEDTPEELAAICDRAMATEREERYATAGALRDDLESYMEAQGWHVTTRDVAPVVGEAFAEERERIRQLIEDRVSAVAAGEGPVSLDLHPDRLRATGQSLPQVKADAETAVSGAPTTASTQLTQSVAPEEPSSRRVLPLAAAGVIVVAAAVVVVLQLREPSQSGSAGPSAAAESSIELLVRYPGDATLRLDGGEVDGHPFRATVARDGSLHRFDVVKPGFETVSRTVAFDGDVELTLELGPPTPSEPTAEPVAEDEPASEDAAASEDEPSEETASPRPRAAPRRPPAPEPTSAPGPEPESTDGSGPSQPDVDIDEDNPYKQ